MPKLTAVLAIASLVCAALALWFRNEWILEQAKTTELRSQLAGIQQSRLGAALTRFTPTAGNAGNSALDDGRSAGEAVKVNGAPAAARPQAAAVDWRKNPIQTQQELLQNPAYREAMVQQRKAQMTSDYLDLASALQVSPEKAAKLIELVADIQVRRLSEDDLLVDDPVEKQKRLSAAQEARRQEHNELLDLLGDAGLERWDAYQASLPTRYQMHDLRDQLSASPEPLRDDQLEPLIAAVHAERVRFNDEINEYDQGARGLHNSMRYSDAWPAAVAATHARIHSSASAILTPVQLARLDAILEDLRQREAAQIQVERMRRGIKVSVATPN